MLSELLVPQFQDWRVDTPTKKYKYPWECAYREDMRNLPNASLATNHLAVITLGNFNWTLYNAGLFGYIDSLELTNDGLEFDFNNQLSAFNLGTLNFPFLYINPNTLLGNTGEVASSVPLRFVITCIHNGNQATETSLHGVLCNNGFPGSGYALGQGHTGFAEAVLWYRQQAAALTMSSSATTDKALMMESTGDRGKALWAPHVGGIGPDPRVKEDWTGHLNSGMSFNKGANATPYSHTGRRLFMGGQAGNVLRNFELTIQMVELWYVPSYNLHGITVVK